MDLNAGQLTRRIHSGLMKWTNGAYKESWTFGGTTLLEMPTSVASPTSHRFHLWLSPIVSLSLGILHEWMRTQMLAKPSSNLLQRTEGDHWGGHIQPGWRTFLMTCLCWIFGYMRLEIWRKIGLSTDWCLCTAQRTCSDVCYYWIGMSWAVSKIKIMKPVVEIFVTCLLHCCSFYHASVWPDCAECDAGIFSLSLSLCKIDWM